MVLQLTVLIVSRTVRYGSGTGRKLCPLAVDHGRSATQLLSAHVAFNPTVKDDRASQRQTMWNTFGKLIQHWVQLLKERDFTLLLRRYLALQYPEQVTVIVRP